MKYSSKKKCSNEPSDELPVYRRARVSKKKNQTNQGGTFLQDNGYGLSITKNCSTFKSRDLLRCVMWYWNQSVFGTNQGNFHDENMMTQKDGDG